ncbi:cytochrome c oxidase subunit VB-domain-containing protein [Lasiosphaeria miniovina]|uniref:Cytochrome c oxidase subunit 4, mitochondrial n=1 Tax=Lasiosphaeria miniovina TaxID=1954250 RepID=A0AA39ZUK9_9PEZI|nr:cytochrome c oxidase subunit VB-domain-containing protein [Lasiosphaeria miniovina]KAK0704011.1 cytochrome c oxidase subunit VB-domain-containing protein [Lasiosphaeria miniovina]
MFLQRSAVAVARRAAFSPVLRRTLATSAVRPTAPTTKFKRLSEVKTKDDLFGPGAATGTVPTDLEQSTGLERLEILGKIEGIDVFDMKPLDASRLGTLEDPILVRSAGDEQYCGCTGFPADSHEVIWLTTSRERPVERCPECGSVYKMEYVGPEEDAHAHDHGHGHDEHAWVEPKTWADHVKPSYW